MKKLIGQPHAGGEIVAPGGLHGERKINGGKKRGPILQRRGLNLVAGRKLRHLCRELLQIPGKLDPCRQPHVDSFAGVGTGRKGFYWGKVLCVRLSMIAGCARRCIDTIPYRLKGNSRLSYLLDQLPLLWRLTPSSRRDRKMAKPSQLQQPGVERATRDTPGKAK